MSTSQKIETQKLSIEPHLVAFIDILGFGHEVKAANNSEALTKIFNKVRRIQQAFQKPSAAEYPESQHKVNQCYGKRVIALSDAVIVAMDFKGGGLYSFSASDLVGWAIHGLAQAQYDCIQADDIFVRGGISVGPFYFENDILISPALVDAYSLESKCADIPIIVLTQTTLEWINTTAGPDWAVPNWQNFFFRRLPDKAEGEPLFALDYLNIAMTADDPEIIFRAHRQKILTAYAATTNDRVRDKYRALMRYHNETIEHTSALLRPHLFDLARYSPQS